MNINKVFAGGRVGKDPELRYTANGKAVANFSVASTEKYKDNETTEWFNITAWDKTAEFAAKYIRKGARVLVIGKLQTRSWEDRDGQKKYATDVIAEKVEVIDWPEKDSTEAPAQEPPFNPDGQVPF